MGVVSVAICSPPQKWGSRPFRSGVSQWWWPSLLRFAPLFSLFFLFPFFLLFVVVSFFHSSSLSLSLSLNLSLSLFLHTFRYFPFSSFCVLLVIRRSCEFDDFSLPSEWDDLSVGRTNGRLMNVQE